MVQLVLAGPDEHIKLLVAQLLHETVAGSVIVHAVLGVDLKPLLLRERGKGGKERGREGVYRV